MSFFKTIGFVLALGLAIILVSVLNGLYWILEVVHSFLQGSTVATPETQEEVQSPAGQKYQIRFFFDWGCDSPFWCGNDAAYAKFDVGPIEPEALGLSTQTSEAAYALAEWHDTALNWNYPLDPGPWRQEECDRFNAAVDALLATVRAELGEEYEVVDRQGRFGEDPDLDRYLADPKGFKR